MWVRFWHKSCCGSGLNSEDNRYEWFDEDPGDNQLEDLAREFVPEWQSGSERGFKFGFERVHWPPEEVITRLTKEYSTRIKWANNMLKILKEGSKES